MSTKFKVKQTGKTVELEQSNFRYKGGEGSIFVIDDVVYKVCEPGKMIPEAKFAELSRLDNKYIIKPEDLLLQKNKPVGYTMRLVPGDAVPLAQILTKAYREREGIAPEKFVKMVQTIADTLRYIHSHDGYLQVDGNEFNYMVPRSCEEVYFIDTNSFQTPSFPATAIMSSIRDWFVPQSLKTHEYVWSKLSDWYSFAIISFYMFTGIHPFKGRHPNFNNLKTFMVDQMVAGKSVLDPEVEFPLGAVYHPFESFIPGGKDGAYMRWYKAIFVDGLRFAAPKDFQSTLAFVAAVREIVSSNNFDIREIFNFNNRVIGYYESKGREVLVTTNNVFLNRSKMNRPAERFRVGFTKQQNIPYACWLENEHVQLQNLETGNRIPAIINGTDIMSCEGRVYIQSLQNIFEMDFIEKGNMVAAAKSVATIMPNATTLFQGVAVQDMFGTLIFSIFPESGHHRPMKIPELNKYRITDAKYERNVLMVLCADKESSQYSRFIFRFAKDWGSYDIRVIENITPVGLNFTVIDKGICVCLTEESKIEIFSNQKDSPNIKAFKDPAIDGEMKLCHAGDRMRFASGDKLFDISVKK